MYLIVADMYIYRSLVIKSKCTACGCTILSGTIWLVSKHGGVGSNWRLEEKVTYQKCWQAKKGFRLWLYKTLPKKSSNEKSIQMHNIHAIVVQYCPKCLLRGTGNWMANICHLSSFIIFSVSIQLTDWHFCHVFNVNSGVNNYELKSKYQTGAELVAKQRWCLSINTNANGYLFILLIWKANIINVIGETKAKTQVKVMQLLWTVHCPIALKKISHINMFEYYHYK